MNKLIIALSVACASACVFADNDSATPTSYEDLKLNEPAAWFEAKASGDGVVLSDGLTTTGAGKLTAENGMLIVETEADPANMTAVTLNAPAVTEDITTVTFEMLASTVPAENLVNMSGKGKIAFAISGEDSTRGFKAWLGDDTWVDISGTAPADDTPYTLVVRFDSRTGVNKVRFELAAGAVLGDGWYEYAGAPVDKTAVKVDLVGSGKIASITGSQISIKAEVIEVGDLGKLYVPEKIAKAYPDLTKKDSALKADVNVATAIALGFIKEDANGNIVKNTTADFTVKADATAKYSDAIPVIFANFNPADVAKQTVITYQLMGSADGSEYSVVEIDDKQTVDNVADIKIPATAITAGKRYFKVVTKVSVNDPNPSEAQ